MVTHFAALEDKKKLSLELGEVRGLVDYQHIEVQLGLGEMHRNVGKSHRDYHRDVCQGELLTLVPPAGDLQQQQRLRSLDEPRDLHREAAVASILVRGRQEEVPRHLERLALLILHATCQRELHAAREHHLVVLKRCLTSPRFPNSRRLQLRLTVPEPDDAALRDAKRHDARHCLVPEVLSASRTGPACPAGSPPVRAARRPPSSQSGHPVRRTRHPAQA